MCSEAEVILTEAKRSAWYKYLHTLAIVQQAQLVDYQIYPEIAAHSSYRITK
jgi:hypothetical protein